MNFTPTKIEGVWIIEMESHHDERGWFARTWCANTLSSHGLKGTLSQCSISFNRLRGTLRGMHYQATPHSETKVVRCLRGAMFDVALDLRADSPTFKEWVGVELSAGNGLALYIPEGCAHGFQTLADDTEVLYMISGEFQAECARGVRWDDPAFDIKWPSEVATINERDRCFQGFSV